MGASNLHYGDWESHFALADELVAFGTAGVTPKTLPVIGTPKIGINPNFIDSGVTARGRAERNQDEFALGNIETGAQFQTRMGNVFLYKFLSSLLQVKPTGVETPGASGKFKHVFPVYSAQPSVNIGFTAWHALRAGVTNDSRLAVGNIVNSLKVSSAENEIGKLDVTTRALSGGKGTLSTPGSAWTNALQHLHRHLILAKIDATDITPAPAAVEFTAVNNLAPWYGTSQTPSELVMLIFNLTGQFTITARNIGMAAFDDYKARTSRKLTFGWGTAVDDVGYFKAIFDATYNAHEPVSRAGIQGAQVGFVSALAESGPTATSFEVWHSSDLAA